MTAFHQENARFPDTAEFNRRLAACDRRRPRRLLPVAVLLALTGIALILSIL